MVKNPYRVLGVSDTATKSECKKAYRRLSAKYHPDSVDGDRDKFEEVQNAWEAIKTGSYVVVHPKKSKYASHISLFKFKLVSE